ncbi:MAG: LysR family transcriptional regulator [Polyangiaceae bacterium]|nr:LysR family transcriptional regulator [Polyangiaceae bacterium]
MDLDELRAFIAVADTESFSAAAKSLNFARSTLTKRVDELELRSGVQLLKRAADGAALTRAGELLATRGRQILQGTKTILAAARDLEKQQGMITLELTQGLPPALEESAYLAFSKAAPNLHWRIRYTDGQFSSNSDAAICIHTTPHPPAENNWKHSKVGSVKCGLLGSPEYVKKNGAPQKVEEIKEHRLLLWERFSESIDTLPLKNGGNVAVSPHLVSPSPHLLRQFAMNGAGIAYTVTSTLPGFLDTREAPELILIDQVGTSCDVWVSSRSDSDTGAIGILATAIIRFTQMTIGQL